MKKERVILREYNYFSFPLYSQKPVTWQFPAFGISQLLY